VLDKMESSAPGGRQLAKQTGGDTPGDLGAKSAIYNSDCGPASL
jgi:hypothetical protein